MFKPKFNNKKQRLSFKIDAGIINNRESDLVTGLKGQALDEVTLFIDDATPGIPSCFGLCERADLRGADLRGADLTDAQLAKADLTRATSDPKTTWPSAYYWHDTTCPDGSNSNDAGNETCGF